MHVHVRTRVYTHARAHARVHVIGVCAHARVRRCKREYVHAPVLVNGHVRAGWGLRGLETEGLCFEHPRMGWGGRAYGIMGAMVAAAAAVMGVV